MKHLETLQQSDKRMVRQANFYIHLITYLVIGSLAAAISLTISSEAFGFLAIFVGWGIIVALHGVIVFILGEASRFANISKGLL